MEERESEKAAIFARVPRAQAQKLERLAFEQGRPKQEILAGLLARYPEPSEEPSLGRYSFRSVETLDVLTLEQLARFLQLDEEAVRGLAETGELPGRKIGDDWRFSRQAILSWLEGGP